MSIIEIIGVTVLLLILLAVLILMFPLVVDTIENEIEIFKQEKERRGKRK